MSYARGLNSAPVPAPTLDSGERPWPFDVTKYDRSPDLTAAEVAELAHLAGRRARQGHWANRTLRILQRPRQPVMDLVAMTEAKECARCGVIAVLVLEMHRRQRAFWAWTSEEWVETLCTSGGAFDRRFHVPRAPRQHLIALSYLLCGFTDLAALGLFDRLALARKVFGRERVDEAIRRVVETVTGWGYYVSHAELSLHRPVCEALLANRSPRLEEVSAGLLARLRQGADRHVREGYLVFSRALFGLGVIDQPLGHAPPRSGSRGMPDATEGVPEGWLGWCRRWQETSTLGAKTRHAYYLMVLKVGRWLGQVHPEAASPERWDRELAAECVAMVGKLAIGQWAHAERLRPALVGKPLSAKAKAHHLAAASAFFRDCQEWGWIPRRFDPHRCFAAPRWIRDLLVPNPRVIADDVWAKLLWAGLNLGEADLSTSFQTKQHYYPLAMVRALAMVWLFTGLRVSEVRRLPVGCVRWQAGLVSDREGGQEGARRDLVCLLDVPANKTGPAFTKPVDWTVGDAIAAWERLRPAQPALVDPKTAQPTHYLFAYRGRPISETYLNDTLIPLLCRKAGVPESDARGGITSHRARSTIASQLFNAKEPMSLMDLQAWLGHRTPASTQHYARITPTKLAKAYADAGYLGRNLRMIEVLVDQEAVKSGAAASGEPWRFYDLGHGCCSYDFFDRCPHRMACARCAFYLPKGSSKAQVLEGKASLQRMLQEIPLTDEERAAVEDGLAAYEKLLAQLADVPTPAGPTPRQLGPGAAIQPGPISTPAATPQPPAKTVE